MNTKALVLAVAAACIGSAAPAFAQHDDHRHRYEQRHDRQDYRQDRREYREDQRERRQMEREVRREVRQEVRHELRHETRHETRHEARHQHYRGAGPRHDLYRGGRLPSVYHGERYVVRDYHRYNLSAPPRGTHWVRAGNDYLLVALATGIIANVLLN